MTRLSRSLVLGSGAIFQAIGLREKLQENHIFIHTPWENLWFPVKISLFCQAIEDWNPKRDSA